MKTKLSSLRRLVTMLFCAVAIGAMAQVTVKGTVIDPTGEPLIGASVVEKGKQNGTVTDVDGNFSIKVPSANATLTVSYVGYLTQDVKLNGKTTVEVTLKENSEALDEVVVVGYGTQRKSDITGSVASLSKEQMAQTIVTNADQMLQGKVAGVQVTQNSGAPGGATSIRIRGASSLNSSNEPLYIIITVR